MSDGDVCLYGDDLFARLREPTPSRKALREAAQLALQVEFSTIPVYLTGMYSITDPSSKPYQTLRSVVIEEMFHVNQAANLVVAAGGRPRFTGQATPVYPGHLPKANPNTTPLLGLYPASPGVFNDIYAGIETPAAWDAVPQTENYNTIGQLYKGYQDAVEAAEGNPFAEGSRFGRQRTDIYIGKFGGTPLEVKCKDSAYAAIHQVVRQGEGSVPPTGLIDALEPFAAYQYYGNRTDGTYGPILGTPYELSHFIKFRQVAVSGETFPVTFPMTANPKPHQYTNKTAKQLSDLFDLFYSLMLVGLELTFVKSQHDFFFGPVLTIMHQILPMLAGRMVTTPIFEGGDINGGPTATPAWRWVDRCWEVDLEKLITQLEKSLLQGGDKVPALTSVKLAGHARDAAPMSALRTATRELLAGPLGQIEAVLATLNG